MLTRKGYGEESTCVAMQKLMRSGHKERIGLCVKNRACISLVCTTELKQPAPTTVMSIITFDPCSDPVALHIHVNSTLLKGKPIIDEWIGSTTSIKAKPDPLGAFNITLEHQQKGVLFGAVHQSKFDASPITLFPNHFIPFHCTEDQKHSFEVHLEKPLTLLDSDEDTDYEEYYSEYDSSYEVDSDKRPKQLQSESSLITDDQKDFPTTIEDSPPVTTESRPSIERIHQMMMIGVLVGIVVIHLILAVVNIIACLKF